MTRWLHLAGFIHQPTQSSRNTSSTHIAVALAAVMAGALLLRSLPPRVVPLLPACPIHQLTGLLCPGCGGTRALLAMLHGRFDQAWQFNPLLLVLSPLLVLYLILTIRRGVAPRLPTPLASALLLLVLTFTIARNL